MTLKRILPYSKSLLSSILSEGDIAIDATVGNGHDTVFLAERVGVTGKVYGYDIQEEAIQNTRDKLISNELIERVTLIQKSHSELVTTLPVEVHGRVKAAVFNLGYLPGGNKEIVTQASSTISAIEQALDVLHAGGLIVIVIYHGHPEGKIERDELLSFVKNLDQNRANVLQYQFINQKNDPPFIIAIEKKQSLTR